MNRPLSFVLLLVAIATVKGSPGTGESMWAKLASQPAVATPVKADPFLAPAQPQSAAPQGRSASTAGFGGIDILNAGKRAMEQEEEEEKPLEDIPKPAAPKLVYSEPPPVKREIPPFARMMLGDLDHPKLASLEDLRKADLRSAATVLELPTKKTIPQVQELLQKTSELLRLFQEIQKESNGFVDDIEKHNKNESKDYIGYYN